MFVHVPMTREAYLCLLYHLSKYVYRMRFEIAQTDCHYRVCTKLLQHYIHL